MIYTLGYTGVKVDKLHVWAQAHHATIVDVRISPRSRNPVWNKGRLSEALGATYVHLPELGNVNYKGGPIQLKAPQVGTQKAQMLLQKGAILLMCVCKDWETCHRNTAAALLSEASGQEIHHLTVEEINSYGDPEQPTLF